MAGRDVLQRISLHDVTRLVNVLKQDLPLSSVVYNWLLVQTEWSKKIPGMSLHVLCPDGRWQHGTVVAFTDGLALENKKYGVVYARPRHDADLAAALTSTRAVPWRHVLHLSGVLERHVAMVRTAAAAAGVSLPAKPPALSHLLYYPASITAASAHVEPEVGVRVSRLEARHLDEVWNLRPIFPESYKPVIRACLEHNLSAGVFKTRPDGSEQLISMTIQMEHGGAGMGQTHPDHLHHGYSTMAAEFFMRAMRERAVEIHAWTSTTNEVVIKYMKEYGVQFVDRVAHVIISSDHVKGRL